MTGCCEWCNQESVELVPIVNRNPTSPFPFEFVCDVCATLALVERSSRTVFTPVQPVQTLPLLSRRRSSRSRRYSIVRLGILQEVWS